MKQELLKEREHKIIKLICREYTSQEIAEKFGLSLKRMEQLRSDILVKTKSRNTVGIVKYAIKNKIYKLR